MVHRQSERFLARGRWRLRAGAAIAAGALAVLPTIGASASTRPAARSHKSVPTLTVWVDSTRVPAVKLYEKTHKNVKINLVTYDGDANGDGTLLTKVALYNRVGHGWPDVAFSEQFNDIPSLTDAQLHYPAALNTGLVPKSTISNFAKGTLSVCMVGGKLYCLRNDLAQDVLWYNKPLLAKFGYSVPTTWEQYQALGEKLAKQHPGYIVGSVGDSWDDTEYLQASRCPMNDVIKANTVLINSSSPYCARMTKLLDPMIKDGSVTTESVFSATFDKTYAGKVLMMVGPSWYGDYVFASKSGLDVPKGQIAAADPLAWKGDKKTTTGDVGGGIWVVSSHTKYPALAASMVTWLATSPVWQTVSPGYPAYAPAARAWLAATAKQGYFAGSVAPAFEKAATEIWSGWSATRYSSDSVFASVVLPALTGGKSFTSVLPAYGQALANYARSDGYTVVSHS